jgi:hypothetical protein
MAKILLAEDDKQIADMISFKLIRSSVLRMVSRPSNWLRGRSRT